MRRLILSLLVALSAPSLFAATVEKSPAPSWVVDYPLDLSAPDPDLAGRDGLWVPIVEHQVNIPELHSYRRYARKYLTQKAVQDSSRISVDFNPAFQTLSWHKLVIHRAGQIIDLLPDQQIRVLAREQELADNIYNGGQTAVIELPSVRPGDIVEYAFSVRGENPIFAGKFGDFVSTSWSIPAAHFLYRLLSPADRPIFSFSEGTKLESSRSEKSPLVEYLWQAKDIPAVIRDGDEPSWDDPYGWLQLTEFHDWAQVVQWALPYYKLPASLPPQLDPLMQRLRAMDSDEARVIAALEYVQDEIRYLSLSEGMHSHQPYEPSEVVGRSYGDCKDKARLLCAILRPLGFDASPALVETAYRHKIAEWLPTPTAFDHVVVRLKWQGRTYWLDPTSTDQRGPLATRFFPAYGKALVIAPDSTGLSDVTPSGYETTSLQCEEHYSIPAYDKPATFDVRTTYRGDRADSMRSSLARNGAKELAKDYLNYYARSFPGIESVADLTVSDDPKANKIVIEEKYSIPELWQPRTGEDKYLYADFYAHTLSSDFDSPDQPRRKSPLAVTYPRNVDHSIIVDFPDDSTFKAESFRTSNPAFSYDYSVSQKGHTLSISHHYASLRDSVPVSDLAKFLADMEKARDVLSYSIWIPKHLATASAPSPTPPSRSAYNIPAILFSILLVQIGLVLALALYFWRPGWPLAESVDTSYRGLGGWLVIVCIGLFARIIQQIGSLNQLAPYFQKHVFESLSKPGGTHYHPLWAPAIYFEIGFAILTIFFSLALLVLFFQRRRTFPALMIVLLAVTPVAILIDLALATPASATIDSSSNAEALGQFFGSLIGAGIWIPYFLKSRRVRATFRK